MVKNLATYPQNKRVYVVAYLHRSGIHCKKKKKPTNKFVFYRTSQNLRKLCKKGKPGWQKLLARRSLRQILKHMEKAHRSWLQADAKAILHSTWENRLLVTMLPFVPYITSQMFSLLAEKPLHYLCDWGCFSPYSVAPGKVKSCIPKGVEAPITSAACGNKVTFWFYSGRIASQAKRFQKHKIIPYSL